MYETKFDTFINTFPQIASYILKPSSSFPSLFTANYSYHFHISLKPTFTTALSRHILSNVLDHAFHITAEFQKNTFDFLPFVSRINYLVMHQIQNMKKALILKAPSQCSREVLARHVHAHTQSNVGQK